MPLAEKKVWVTAPHTNTLGDVTTNTPYINAFFAGAAISFTAGPIGIGQYYVPSGAPTNMFSGYSCWDITPYPSQSVGYRNRIGSQITITGMYTRAQLWQMPQCVGPVRLKIMFFTTPGAAYQSSSSLVNLVNNMHSVNPFIQGTGINSGFGIVDYNSDLAQDFRSQYRILRTVYLTVPGDTVTSEVQVKEFKCGLKFPKGHKVCFNQDTNNITSGQIFMLVLADVGNIGSAAFSGDNVSNVPLLTSLSGVYMNPMTRSYYQDL